MGFRLLRFTNTIILASIAALTLSGVYGLFWPFPAWLFDVHRFSAWILIGTLPWKVAISLHSLRRGIGFTFDRGPMIFISLSAAVLTMLVLTLGLAWGFRLLPETLWLRQTALSWHWMLGLALILPFALHAWRRWPRPRRADLLSRRAALHVFGLGIAAGLGWWISLILGEKRASPDSSNRFTGSRLAASYSGNQFPVTHTLAATPDQVNPERWRLIIEGAVFNQRVYTYPQLLTLRSATKNATLDCTLGWYTVQEWRGLPLNDLLDDAGITPQAFAVRFESATGYANILPLEEANQVLLATHVGDETLEHSHGFPLRAIVPSRRGWFWVKWLQRIEVIGL
jgi:hypothetical protein